MRKNSVFSMKNNRSAAVRRGRAPGAIDTVKQILIKAFGTVNSTVPGQ